MLSPVKVRARNITSGDTAGGAFTLVERGRVAVRLTGFFAVAMVTTV